MSPLTHALISYWHRLPTESPAARRKALDDTRERIRAGLETAAALVPFALGDVDDASSPRPRAQYVAATRRREGVEADGTIAEATEWVRRGLALNRGAVFGALLALEDERIETRLAAAASRAVGGGSRDGLPRCSRGARWPGRRLPAGLARAAGKGSPQRECRALSSALAAGASARAA